MALAAGADKENRSPAAAAAAAAARSVCGWEGVFRNGSIFLHHRENEAGQKEEKRKGGGGGDYHSIDESSGFGRFGLEPACLGQRVFETDGG